MKNIFFVTLILISNLAIRAQQSGVKPDDPAFIQKYANFDFKGQFAANIDQDVWNNYFLLDFSKFSSRFERVYFMNLSFTADKIVNIDPDIVKNNICFLANKKYDVPEIVKIFDELNKKTVTAGTTLSEAEKAKWLKENDKYK